MAHHRQRPRVYPDRPKRPLRAGVGGRLASEPAAHQHLGRTVSPMITIHPGPTDSANLVQNRARFRHVSSPKNSPAPATKWRAAHVPTHGGLKLADSPPCYKTPGQRRFQCCSGMGAGPGLRRVSDARHYARHLVNVARNGAHSGRWSR